LLLNCVEDAHAFGNYLGTDAVAWENSDSHSVDTRAGCEDS
jgi:hypothetical protein